MYISQNLRQSWYGNLLGEEENDDDQDAMKVEIDQIDWKGFERDCLFSVQWWKPTLISWL